MNLDRLQVFLHIVDEGSMTAAAKAAHLSQSAVSRSLQQLESDMGMSLFQRLKNNLVLTNEGRALVPEARSLLAEAGSILARVGVATHRNYYDLRLGAIGCVANYLLPSVLPCLLADHPGLVLKMCGGRSPELIEGVRENTLDMAIVATRGIVSDTICHPIGDYRLRYYGLKGRFAGLNSVETFAGLARFPLVDIAQNPGELVPRAIESNHQFLLDDCATVKTIIMSGLAVGDLVDYSLSQEERVQLDVAAIEPNPSCQLYLIVAPGFRGAGSESLVSAVSALVRRAHAGRILL